MEGKLLTLLVVMSLVTCNGRLIKNTEKIPHELRVRLERTKTVSVLVSFVEGTESALEKVVEISQNNTRGEKATAVYTALLANAEFSQRYTLNALSDKFPWVKATSFWITNQIHIAEADSNIVNFLASIEDVSDIFEEPIIYLDYELNSVGELNDTISPNAEWGVDKIQTQQAWATPGGNDGAGVIVATMDSGAQGSHQALVNNFVGSYGWFDAYQRTAAPFDDHGHGTHVTATLAGSLGFGVAPGSKWAACKALRSDNSGTSAAFISCGQFFTCPTDPQGNNADCSKAPHIVSNSWIASGNGGGVTWFNPVISAWHAAGIIPVFANGNSGTACSTGGSPADQNVIAVGSTDSNDALSSFSSVGPSYYGEIKPDVSAPGTSVRSAYHTSDTATATMSGTSMATPHTAGVLALLKSRDPSITYMRAKSILQENTDTSNLISQGRICNGIRDSQFPNYHFGSGRINALKALRALIGKKVAE